MRRFVEETWPALLLTFGLLCMTAAFAIGCDGNTRSYAPSLDAVMGRVDVGRLLECAALQGNDRARCLGASVLTTALNVAVDKATAIAERAKDAANPAAGAEVSDADRDRVARELDKALDDVGAEIAKAQDVPL